MTFQESSNFDCATFAKNWNWRIGKNRIGNRGNARAFLLVLIKTTKFFLSPRQSDSHAFLPAVEKLLSTNQIWKLLF